MAGRTATVLRVLVADDCRETVDGLASLLTSWGHEARAALDGSAALEAAWDYQPDVVLLGLDIPRVGGREVAALLRTQAAAGQPLLVALSGRADDRYRQLAREAGFDALLVKPVRPEALQRALQRALAARAGKA